MKKAAVIEARVDLENDALITFDSCIEISLDCFISKRVNRTIALKYGDEDYTYYPAKIADIKVTESKGDIKPDHTFSRATTAFRRKTILMNELPFKWAKRINRSIIERITTDKFHTATIKAEYYIEYDYNEFEDIRDKIPSDSAIGWARVHFKIICPNCNKEIECSIQNNLVRPYSRFCDCGHLLYIEKEEMPIIKNDG
jgi:hypothetical protein